MRFLIAALFALGFQFTSAQSNWNFSHITTDDGLSTGTVNCVFKDSKGFIWIGTIDGLNRYDGYEITVYKKDKNDPKSISGNIISAISEDANGNIWIGTRNNGISVFEWESDSFLAFEDLSKIELPEGRIRALERTFNDQMLIGIEGGGLLLYDVLNATAQQYRANSGQAGELSDNTILSLARASEKTYWVTSLATQVDLFNVETGRFEHVSYDPSYEPNENTRKVVMEGSNGILWLGTDGKGLVKIDRKTNEQVLYDVSTSNLKSNIITTLYEGRNGSIYVGTDGKGINVFDPVSETFTFVASSLLDPNSLSSDAVYQIYEDDSGVIWVSTFRGGVNTYSPQRTKFELYKQVPYENNSLSFASVIDVFETRDGKIWIGTDGGGLDVLDPETGNFEHFKYDPADPFSISTNVAIAIEEDKNGYLWIGTYAGGVNRLDRSTGRFTRFLPDLNNPNTINGKNVWHIVEDSRGEIWFGLLGGLDRYDSETGIFTHYNADGSKNSLSSDLVYTLFEDSKGNIWVGTEDGGLNLFERNTNSFRQFTQQDGDSTSLLNNSVRTLFEDSKNQLWIGTAAGANILDINSLQIVAAPVNELLPNPVVNGIQEDDRGNLWIATNSGLSRYNPTEHTIQNFGKSDGLQGNEFNYTSSTKTRDGTMYFGGVKGLNRFHPSQVKMSDFNPKLVITDIKIFDQSVSTITDDGGNPLVDGSIQILSELTLRHDQNVLELVFASLDYTYPVANKYRYKLDGFDKEWMHTTTKKRAANYTNLNPGSYTFIVEGTNSDGVWSRNRQELIITVTPPWWATWWFRTIALLAILGVTGYIVRWRARANRMQKEELKRQVEEATSQVTDQNEVLQAEQEKLEKAIEETNFVVSEAIDSGNFSARIDLTDKLGAWKELSQSINILFDSIVIPFNRITEIVGAMASSNLTMRYELDAKGDILKLTSSLDYALNTLSDLIATIKQTTTVVGHLSEEMNITSKEMQVGTAEIASSTSELSNGAQEQVSRIDESSNKLESIMEFSSSVGDQAQSINQAAMRGVDLSTNGQGEMKAMDDSMHKMEQASAETVDSIANLLEKSSEISSILNSIKEISVETNMLALNATIEAAKAGESGRGFAVVADQIRRLAENSSSFANDIESIVNDVQTSIGSVSDKVNEMGSDIAETVSASQNASKSFTELASSSEQTFNLSEKIVSLADHQFQSVKEVVQLMESVVVIAEQAAAGTEEIASSANELSTGMTEYQDQTDKVSEIIKLLNEKMDQFRLK